MKQAVLPGDWFATIDLKDAYFHIPIKRNHWWFLHFGFEGKLLEFSLPLFGICDAVIRHAYVQGNRSVWYKDTFYQRHCILAGPAAWRIAGLLLMAQPSLACPGPHVDILYICL